MNQPSSERAGHGLEISDHLATLRMNAWSRTLRSKLANVALGCLHAELDIEQFAACNVANRHDRWVLQFAFRRDREEPAMNFLGATNPAEAVLLFQLFFED
jgi:hypothetical protein